MKKVFIYCIIRKKLFFLLLLFLMVPGFVWANTYTDSDNTGSGFGGGTHTNTQWDAGNNWLEMDATGQSSGFATFTSRIINLGKTGSWDTFSWVPQRPLYKELPNAKAAESGYTAGNANMSGNVFLMHFNAASYPGTSGDTTDSSGEGNNGQSHNSPSVITSGIYNNAISFDGTNDYIDVPDDASLNVTTAITIEGWFKVGTISTRTRYILDNGVSGSDGSNAYAAQMNTSGQLIFNTRGFSTNGLVTTLGYADNVWHHFAMTYDSAGDRYRRIYIDGTLVKTGSQEAVGKLISYSGDNTSIMRIGQYSYSTAINYTWPGLLDELGIYNRALSSTEVYDHYTRGALRASLQVRSCNDNACSGESFVGQSGSSSNFFEEQDTNTTSLPSFSLASAVSNNQYFQYQLVFESIAPTLSPEINSISVVGTPNAGITVSSISGNTTEAGGTATYTVVLDSQPSANVTIGVSSSDASEGTVSPASLTFTSGNWSTPQTVTITGVDDSLDDGDITFSIVNATASSADSNYNNLNPDDVTVTNTDNDVAGIAVVSVSENTTESGGTASYTLVLNSQPTNDVSIEIASSDVSEGTVAPSSVTFTSLNWNTPQTITITGVDDGDVDGDVAYSIINSAATSLDAHYNNLNPSDVNLTNSDNDSTPEAVPEFGSGALLLIASGTFFFLRKKFQFLVG